MIPKTLQQNPSNQQGNQRSTRQNDQKRRLGENKIQIGYKKHIPMSRIHQSTMKIKHPWSGRGNGCMLLGCRCGSSCGFQRRQNNGWSATWFENSGRHGWIVTWSSLRTMTHLLISTSIGNTTTTVSNLQPFSAFPTHPSSCFLVEPVEMERKKP